MLAANQSKKAAQTAAEAGKAAQVDINALDEQTRQIALKNAEQSANLERLMTPEVPQLRTAANNAVIQGLQSDSSIDTAKAKLSSSLGIPLNTPLLNEAIAKARQDLALGGKLSADTQNSVTRKGLATAGTVGGGLGLGRDIVARDLGLTSQQLEQQRLSNAFSGAGLEQTNATNNQANLLNQIQLLQSINSNRNNFSLGAAAYGQSIQQPIVGLDPASAGNIAVGNSNATGAALANKANIQGQQATNYGNMAGQIGGGLLAYNMYNQKPAGG